MGVLSKIKTNNSTFYSKTTCEDGHKWWVSFEFYPFAVGENLTIFEGRMYNKHGYWSQSKAAVKTLNHQIGTEENLLSAVVSAKKARVFAESFRMAYPGSKVIDFVQPCLAEMDSISIFNTPFRYIKGYEKQLADGEHVLIEEHVDGNFQTFLDINGVSCEQSELLNTFLHYSYVESNGDLVVSNLQGCEHESKISLSNVAIHSRTRDYGPKDLGETGIINVFKNHRCTNICKNWPTPSFGLVPTAPILSETKCNVVPYVNINYQSMCPPPYEESKTSFMTESRPMVHGKS